jgi:hypothetical protein
MLTRLDPPAGVADADGVVVAATPRVGGRQVRPVPLADHG